MLQGASNVCVIILLFCIDVSRLADVRQRYCQHFALLQTSRRLAATCTYVLSGFRIRGRLSGLYHMLQWRTTPPIQMFVTTFLREVVMWRTLLLILIAILVTKSSPSNNNNGDLYLWIDEQQVKLFSGFSMEIYAIVDGNVLPYILDPNFEKYLPIIPSEVGYVNFTWKAGMKKYFYNFDRLQSFDESILDPPVISINTNGRIPRRPKMFSVFLPCSGNSSGIASFGIGLSIESRKGRPLPGTPLRLRLRKECAQRGPDPECDKKCANGGWCNHEKICQCLEGYMGQYCKTALCYPQCMNGGSCTAPGVCSCPVGFQGRHCEGGICAEKCLNGGKCIQKDTCECSKGYYGLRCEFSKCIIPCLNGGRCRGVNKCRCPAGFNGDHCEIGRRVPQRSPCTKPCRHGTCRPNNTCLCDNGWFGRLCHQKVPQIRKHRGKQGSTRLHHHKDD